MTWDQRLNYQPVNPVDLLQQRIDQAWQQATQQTYHGLQELKEDAGYLLSHPWQALDSMGDFAEDLAEQAWAELRESYGQGLMLRNQIVRVVQTPCEEKWTVLLETALPAAGDALWLLLVPSPQEILEEYLQPYPSKSGRRGSNRSDARDRRDSPSGKRRRSWRGIPDINQMIANNLPGSDLVQGRDVGLGQKWLFEAIDLADRVLWYFLVFEVYETFVTGWTSGLREARFCTQQWESLFVADNHVADAGFPENIDPPWSDIQIAKNTQPYFQQHGVEFLDQDGNVRPASGEFAWQGVWQIDEWDLDDLSYRAIMQIEHIGTGPTFIVGETVTLTAQGPLALSVSGGFANAARITLIIDRVDINGTRVEFGSSDDSISAFATPD